MLYLYIFIYGLWPEVKFYCYYYYKQAMLRDVSIVTDDYLSYYTVEGSLPVDVPDLSEEADLMEVGLQTDSFLTLPTFQL